MKPQPRPRPHKPHHHPLPLALAGLSLLLLALLAGPSQAHLGAQGTPTPAAVLPVVHRTYPPAQPPPPDLPIPSLHDDARDESVASPNAGGSAQEMAGAVGGLPAGYVRGAGVAVRVYSGPAAVDDPPGDLFWSTAYLWNNEGDEAVLYDEGDGVVDRVCYLDGCL